MNAWWNSKAAEALQHLREQRPLVLSFTNSVVQPLTANLLLAVGAVPAMLNDGGEAAEMIRICADALLINVGTLSRGQADAMRQAVRAAGEAGVPWVLDPVAVGLLSFRTEFCCELLNINPPALIRGNGSEIMALAGEDATTRGPESNNSSESAIKAAQRLAKQTGAAVLVTGVIDYATDGATVVSIANGHRLMTRVTGVGCAMGALCGALLAVSSDSLSAAVFAAALMGLAGERAAAAIHLPGSFAVALLDVFDAITPQELQTAARIAPII